MKKEEKLFSIREVLIIVIISSFFMFFLGGISIYRHLGGINFTLVDNDKELKKFISTYKNLLSNYYGDIDKSTIISGAINGMYSSLNDPYTTYLDKDSTNTLDTTLTGEYVGIGIRISDKDNFTVITKILDNSPAFKAGIKEGDIIKKINEVDVSELKSEDITEILKVMQGDIDLSVLREDKAINFSLKPDKVLVPTVKEEIITYKDKKIGYIAIELFSDTADIQFEDSIINLEKSGIESLIIDLRNNTGGYLEVTKNIAELFLKKGKVIYSLVNKKQKVVFKDITNESRNYQIVVLVNGKTASSAEILASALKYSYGANIVGEKTYGKGKVQQKTTLKDGTSIKYTTAKWLMPNGKFIDKIGITPDYNISLKIDKLVDGDLFSDSQILYALDMLVD